MVYYCRYVVGNVQQRRLRRCGHWRSHLCSVARRGRGSCFCGAICGCSPGHNHPLRHRRRRPQIGSKLSRGLRGCYRRLCRAGLSRTVGPVAHRSATRVHHSRHPDRGPRSLGWEQCDAQLVHDQHRGADGDNFRRPESTAAPALLAGGYLWPSARPYPRHSWLLYWTAARWPRYHRSRSRAGIAANAYELLRRHLRYVGSGHQIGRLH